MRVYSGVTGGAVGVAASGAVREDTRRDRLSALFEAHHQRLYRLARRMTQTSEDARDLVQETFLRATRTPASVPEGAASEEAWLVRVLINVCRDGWRKRAGRRRLDGQHLGETHPLAQADPEAAAVARATVWRALEQLPPRRRAAIVLYELEGARIPDIASMLGVSAVTVRWHLSRGRHELARIIGGGPES